MRYCRCGSYAINDDPEQRLCDKCWRDEEIDRLRAALTAIRDRGRGRGAAVCVSTTMLQKIAEQALAAEAAVEEKTP